MVLGFLFHSSYLFLVFSFLQPHYYWLDIVQWNTVSSLPLCHCHLENEYRLFLMLHTLSPVSSQFLNDLSCCVFPIQVRDLSDNSKSQAEVSRKLGGLDAAIKTVTAQLSELSAKLEAGSPYRFVFLSHNRYWWLGWLFLLHSISYFVFVSLILPFSIRWWTLSKALLHTAVWAYYQYSVVYNQWCWRMNGGVHSVFSTIQRHKGQNQGTRWVILSQCLVFSCLSVWYLNCRRLTTFPFLVFSFPLSSTLPPPRALLVLRSRSGRPKRGDLLRDR